MVNINFLCLIIIIFSSLIIGASVSYYFYKLIKRSKIKKKFDNSKFGEFEAKSFLNNLGFSIIAEQISLKSNLFVDNKKYNYQVRADYLVEKNGKKAIVEVKTGQEATNPLNINTRRQLLEYTLLYNVEKVYLFDAQNKILKEIKFLLNPIFNKKTIILFGIIAVILITLIELLIFKFLF